MRSSVKTLITTVAGLTLGAVAACTDPAGPRMAPTDAPSLTVNRGGGGADKVTICHAAGRDGTTKYVEITVARSASYAHIDEHGTPRAGHEDDFYATQGRGCPGGMAVTKTLVEVMGEHMQVIQPHVMNGVAMYEFPQAAAGTLPTLWLRYRIDYVGSGQLTDDLAAPCAALNAYYSNPPGTGFLCTTAGFYTPTDGGQAKGTSISVSGAGTYYIMIDIANNGACGDRPFINRVTLDPRAAGLPTITGTAAAVWLWTPACT